MIRDDVVYTGTPGFRAQIWASNSPPDPDVFVTGPGGWVRLADIPSMQHKQSIALPGSSTGPPKYRYYLVWIKTLPSGKLAAELNEIALYGSSR